MNEKYGPKGLTILAFPVNQFLHQEPGTNEEIKAFATAHACPPSETFRLFAKSTANDPMCTVAESNCTASSDTCCVHNDGVYTLLRGVLPGKLDWNFAVFLVDKAGAPVKRFDSSVWADPTPVNEEVEKLLLA